MEPTKTKHVFKQGETVIIKDKHDLLEEFGADEFGYPKTQVTWNRDGHMDHLCGMKAVITNINDVFVSVDVLDKLPDLEYGWGVSIDMLAPDDGSYISTTGAAVEPLRAFMPKTKKPTVKTVWKSLTALKKKEGLEDGAIAQLMMDYMQLDFDKFKHRINHAKSFRPSPTLPNALTALTYYPNMDIEELSILAAMVNNTSKQAGEVKEVFMALARNKDFEKEFTNQPFTPYKRIIGHYDSESVDSAWTNLEFHNDLVNNEEVNSEDSLRKHIHKTIVRFMDTNQLHTLTDEKIEVK